MITLGKLLVEGRYDSMITQLSKRLLSVIKDSWKSTTATDGKFAGIKIYYNDLNQAPDIDSDAQSEIYFEEIENELIPLEFYLTLKVQWIKGLSDLRKGGDAYNDAWEYQPATGADLPLVEIRFEIDPDEYPHVLSEIAMELRDTLRHEIEHLTQSGWNLKPSKFMPSDAQLRKKIAARQIPAYRYFTLPKEIDANIHGLYLQAKKQKRPFRDVVNLYLDSHVVSGLITSNEKIKILDAWRNRMPALAIRQDL